MKRRPALSMVEVLMAMFIMAIGMMALLALFPLGAVSMAQALKDDRCASTASMAENVAIAMNLRHDNNVNTAFAAEATASQPLLVYVDPNGFLTLPAPAKTLVGGVTTIQRIAPIFASTPQFADRWFSLPDDITFLENGTPDTINTGGFIDRGRRYSYAYLLRKLPSNLVQLYVVVYSNRPVGALTVEPTFTATGAAGSNGIVMNAAGTSIKRGGWILDPVGGFFYRVTNIADAGGATVVDVQPNLAVGLGGGTNAGNVVIMDNVAEVFDKGTGWQP
jgi:hypothetical protein